MSGSNHCCLRQVDHGTTTEEAATHEGGARGKGGDILWRYGNPQVYRGATRKQQQLFCQHSANFIRGAEFEGQPSEGNVLVFSNGAAPHRLWSTIDEISPPDTAEAPGVYAKEEGKPFGPGGPSWRFGPSAGKRGS